MVKLLRRIINLFKKCKMAKINDTKNFLMSAISTFVLGNAVTPTLDDVCQQGNTTTTSIQINNVGGLSILTGPLTSNGSTFLLGSSTVINGTVDINNTADISGNTTIGGTLGVTGASTLDSVAVTNNATVGGTLGVTGGATFSLGATINGAGLAVNGSGGIVVTDVAGITSFGPVAGTALSSTGGLLVSGTSILGEIDSAGPADIADTLTLSKATGTGLQVDSNAIVDGVLYLNKATGNGLEVTANILVGGSVAAFGTLAGNSLNIAQSTPASASATGITGTIAIDANYIYVCTATDTWKRVAIATW
jgi:fibronectin-binding autotransporter adhesin